MNVEDLKLYQSLISYLEKSYMSTCLCVDGVIYTVQIVFGSFFISLQILTLLIFFF